MSLAKKTVRVRIAVAVDHTGHWNAVGARGMADDEMISYAVDCVSDGERRYFLEAELDVPEAPTVQATVTENNHD